MATRIKDPSEPISRMYGGKGDTWHTISQKYAKTDEYIFEVLNALNGTGALALPAPSGGRVFHGNADTASRLQTARKISLSGGASGSASFDGGNDIAINITSLDAGKLAGSFPPAWASLAPSPQFAVDSQNNLCPIP